MAFRKKLFKKIGGLRQILSRERTLLERLQSIAHLLTGNILSSVIGLIGFALTARALGPAGYGILALCFSYTRAVERIVSFQSWQPLIKYGAHSLSDNADDFKEMQSLLKFGLLLDVSAALAGWLIAVLFILLASPWLGISEDGASLAILYCTVLPFQVSGMPTAVLRLYGRFMAIAYGQVATSVLRVALCAIGVATGAGLFEFTLIWMSAQIIGTLVLVLFALAELRRQGILSGLLSAPLRGITARFPGLWKFAISANLSLTIRSSANELDTLLVGYLADPTSAGLYHIAKRIGRIAQQAGGAGTGRPLSGTCPGMGRQGARRLSSGSRTDAGASPRLRPLSDRRPLSPYRPSPLLGRRPGVRGRRPTRDRAVDRRHDDPVRRRHPVGASGNGT